MRWRDQSEPVAAQALAALGRAQGAAVALAALAATRVAALCVVVPRPVRGAVDAFLAASDVEAGGLLLGRPYVIGAGDAPAVVSIERFVPGRVAQGTGVSLALGTAVWDEARAHLDGGLAVVGWVHSHPDLGAFFSATDRRTQRAFFASPWQVGLCIDPVRGEEAWFRGADSESGGIVVLAA